MSVLHKDIVLVLNKNWQAIGVKTPAEVFSMLMTDVATALFIENDNMYPMKWTDWIEQNTSDNDFVINTVSRSFKIPKVIILCKFDRVPKKRPAFSSKNIWLRDKGRCAYSGKKLKPEEGNIDHLIPKSRGGQTTWTNCVLAHKDINAKKANKTPEEAGLKLLIKPEQPKELPVTFFIKNKHKIREWNYFLHHENKNDN
jgi:5-methylcytosine-specific restriction endonuclease McrA